MDREDSLVSSLLMELRSLLEQFPEALRHRATEIEAGGKDPELAAKLVNGADVMRDSGNLYLSWARHYALLSEGEAEGASDEDESEDFNV